LTVRESLWYGGIRFLGPVLACLSATIFKKGLSMGARRFARSAFLSRWPAQVFAACLAWGPAGPALAAEAVLLGAVNSLTGRFAAQGNAVPSGGWSWPSRRPMRAAAALA